MTPPFNQTPDQLRTQEHDLLKALQAWYIHPGVQRELLKRENEAVQIVLEVLGRRSKKAKR